MDYEKLYKAYYLQVYSYTISLAKNREIAEEITQNTFYKAVSTTSQFKGKSDELTWLCSIAKNLYHDEKRRKIATFSCIYKGSKTQIIKWIRAFLIVTSVKDGIISQFIKKYKKKRKKT